MLVIQWSDIIEVVLVMERFPSYIVDVLDGECKSWNLVMVGVGVLMCKKMVARGSYKMEVSGIYEKIGIWKEISSSKL
jgi:hypothetical protein